MNPYAHSARLTKVGAMLSVLARLCPEAFRSSALAAEFLATWPQENRVALAVEAKVSPPSPETWVRPDQTEPIEGTT